MDAKKQALEELKTQGLDVAEEGLKKVLVVAFSLIRGLLKEQSSKWMLLLMPILIPALGLIESSALKAVDKIDGKEG